MKSYVFKVVVEPDKFEDGRDAWHASCPALKGYHTWGYTYEESLVNIREAIDLYVQDLLEAGKKFQSTRELSNFRNLLLSSVYDESTAWPAGPSFRPCARSCGFSLHRVRGSHRIYRHADGRRVVAAFHSLSQTFPIGALRAMIESAAGKMRTYSGSG